MLSFWQIGKQEARETLGSEHQTLRAWAPRLSSPCIKLRSLPSTHLFLNSHPAVPRRGSRTLYLPQSQPQNLTSSPFSE